MLSGSENAGPSSQSSKSLRVDFFESGKGDTIVITFPDGGIGIVDAHPSPKGTRPNIVQIAEGKRIHFVCLTHPHEDHGRDLIPILETHPAIAEFWHTSSDIQAFVYRVQEAPNWPTAVQDFAREMSIGYANFLLDLYGAVAERDIPIHQARAGDEARNICGVDVHVLAPEEAIQQKFTRFWLQKAGRATAERPDLNLLSAVLALEWGKSVILLGGDALRQNWASAIRRYKRTKLPKAVVFKVPHHGASNTVALNKNAREDTYFDVCARAPVPCKALLFAGDTKHPHAAVFRQLSSRMDLHCVVNGIRGKTLGGDLRIDLPGAKPIYEIESCQPSVSFEVDVLGSVTTIAGVNCENCRFRP